MLRIAETWLRAELKSKIASGIMEPASGEAAIVEKDPRQQQANSEGGYSSGRMKAYAGVGHV